MISSKQISSSWYSKSFKFQILILILLDEVIEVSTVPKVNTREHLLVRIFETSREKVWTSRNCTLNVEDLKRLGGKDPLGSRVSHEGFSTTSLLKLLFLAFYVYNPTVDSFCAFFRMHELWWSMTAFLPIFLKRDFTKTSGWTRCQKAIGAIS